MEQVYIKISEDEALVLFEFLERLGDTENPDCRTQVLKR
jgi:hypothetical protein